MNIEGARADFERQLNLSLGFSASAIKSPDRRFSSCESDL